VPLDRLESTTMNLRPKLLIASAQHLLTAQTLLPMSVTLARLKVPLAFGGSIFNRLPSLRHHIAGHFLGETLSEVTGAVQEILHAPWPLQEIIETPHEYIGALEHYRERRPVIEADMSGVLNPKTREVMRQVDANTYLAQYLEAALALGDMDFLDSDLSWVRGLLSTHQLPDDVLQGYLQVYLASVQKHLDRRGTIIVEWFQRALKL
jgi:hypothetical protein